MNIDQFRALKPGDRIENPMGASTGEVTAIDDTGVTVRWDGSALTRRFSVVGTAWFHWTLAEVQFFWPISDAHLCCSAITPCAHQRQHPGTLCTTCRQTTAQPG